VYAKLPLQKSSFLPGNGARKTFDGAVMNSARELVGV
jgi:hypothetical protein